MDLNMKQWRSQQQHESDLQQPTSAKLTRHLLDPQLQQQQQQTPSALRLFVPELTVNLSADSSTPATSFPKREMGSYFSLGQWQELELQALIFRHMLAGAAIPPHLLHLVKKSVLSNSPSPSYNYLHQQLQHYPHYHPPLLQSGGAGYWGKGGMDPEPGRCRRTDGKKWRCSRDVVAGHKYCERHMHRGRNRSRKPVEIPALPSSSSSAGGLSDGGGGLKAANSSTPQPLPAMAAGTHFNLSGLSPSIDLFHLNQRPSDSRTENKGGQLETQNEVSAGDENSSGGQVLRHFFDDWPRSLQDQPENASSVITSSSNSCGLSIYSIPSNPNSDFSLKLSTGNININGDHPGGGGGGGGGGGRSGLVRGQQLQLNRAASWGTNQVVGPLGPGGPLAEALGSSSTSNSSPASVLNRSSKSDTSYVATRIS